MGLDRSGFYSGQILPSSVKVNGWIGQSDYIHTVLLTRSKTNRVNLALCLIHTRMLAALQHQLLLSESLRVKELKFCVPHMANRLKTLSLRLLASTPEPYRLEPSSSSAQKYHSRAPAAC